MNVYWEPSPSKWNADIAAQAQTDNAPVEGDMTVDRIDTFLASLFHSQYFLPLSAYSVQASGILPSIFVSGCGPLPGSINDALNQMGAFVTCVLNQNPNIDPNVTILNVFLPPQVGAASPQTDFCATVNGFHFIGEHDKFGSPAEVAVIPANSTCSNDMSALSHAMTHEMVEAATDPLSASITGWKVPWWEVTFDASDEIADICELEPRTQMNNPGSQVSNQPFLYGSMSTYYVFVPSGNSEGTCVPLPPASVTMFTATSTASPFGPQITSSAACGAGSAMVMAVKVHDIGPPPWDEVNGSNTVFLNAFVDASARNGGQWSAGGIHNFPPDNVTLGTISWGNPDSSGNAVVVANGFGPAYGQSFNGAPPDTVRAEDTLTLNIFDTNFGQQLFVSMPAENVAAISGLGVVGPPLVQLPSAVLPQTPGQWFYAGDAGFIFGSAVGSQTCGQGLIAGGARPIEGANVNVQYDPSDHILPANLTVPNSGFFVTPYTAPIAGPKTVKTVAGNGVSAVVTYQVHPGVGGATPDVGSIAGQQAVTISGIGFVAGQTTLSEAATNWTATGLPANVTSSQSLTFQTASFPASTLANGKADADLVVNVNGVPSDPISYTYVLTGQPILNLQNGGCEPDSLAVDMYDPNGSESAQTISLTATAPIFSSGTTANVQPGGSETIVGSGSFQVTATPQGPGKAATQSFTFPPRLCVAGFLKGTLSTSSLPQRGQVGDINLQPTCVASCTPATSGTIYWGTSGDPFTGGDSVSVFTTDIGAIAQSVTVTSLGITAQRASLRQTPSYLLAQSAGQNKPQFIGKSLRIGRTGTAQSGDLGSSAAVTFILPTPASLASDFRIMHLTAISGISAWQEIPTVVVPAHLHGAIRARITDIGDYALARVSPK